MVLIRKLLKVKPFADGRNKGSTFSSVILRPECWKGPAGVRTRDLLKEVADLACVPGLPVKERNFI